MAEDNDPPDIVKLASVIDHPQSQDAVTGIEALLERLPRWHGNRPELKHGKLPTLAFMGISAWPGTC